MAIWVVIILTLIAIILFVIVRKGFIDNKTLETLANIATVVAFLAAILVFVIPSPSFFNDTESTIDQTQNPISTKINQELALAPSETPISESAIFFPTNTKSFEQISTETIFVISQTSNKTPTPEQTLLLLTSTIQFTPQKLDFSTPTPTPIPNLTPITIENAGRIKLVATYDEPVGQTFAFSPSGDYLVTPFSNGLILYEINTWRQLQEINTFSRTRAWDASFSNDERFVAFTDFYRNVRLLEFTPGKRLNIITDIKDEGAQSIAFSPSGDQIATGRNGSIRIWSLIDGTLISELGGHTEGVNSLEFSNDGTFLVSGSYDGTIGIWDSQDYSLIQFISVGSPVNDVEISPNGSILASACSDGMVRLWNLNDFSLLMMLDEHVDSVKGVAFSHDGKFLVSAAKDRTIQIWRTNDGTLIQTLNSEVELEDIAISPDGTIMATLGWVLQLWGVPTN